MRLYSIRGRIQLYHHVTVPVCNLQHWGVFVSLQVKLLVHGDAALIAVVQQRVGAHCQQPLVACNVADTQIEAMECRIEYILDNNATQRCITLNGKTSL